MASPRNDADNGASGPVGSTLTGDAATQAAHERRIAAWLISGIVLLLIFLAVLVALFGLPVLGIAGLVGTAIVFIVLLAYAAGW